MAGILASYAVKAFFFPLLVTGFLYLSRTEAFWYGDHCKISAWIYRLAFNFFSTSVLSCVLSNDSSTLATWLTGDKRGFEVRLVPNMPPMVYVCSLLP